MIKFFNYYNFLKNDLIYYKLIYIFKYILIYIYNDRL